ncbi:hypothetical protein Pmar_PMAR019062 [Perkinsus marinus ATCC 50983]|uniref:Apple domain-containing protein n=1 Tax=Perkinsus marinus (strain ATCC 50983 / TXsc) TaxID=423536 RepID=C5KTR8_PERM5|nr:hypothetical protein Pmar_PMAR019062 [Perkinsus marinus ATCC 50983]EER11960.1 hypothetical protein Pmar_PMAR019062 [Perkinsus marinus ATCC 50983]|eukprot:XP_002780165.1 hypothetical protein Pmar_PMAR019062 [Perkinsus marinus ATCC 50983]
MAQLSSYVIALLDLACIRDCDVIVQVLYFPPIMQIVLTLVTILASIVHHVGAGSWSGLVIAEKMLGADSAYCQRVCEERPGCIFSYCGDDNKCHGIGSGAAPEEVTCGAAATSFDSCTSACDSVVDCSASTWKSFCKTWLDTPVCFGLLQGSNGLCYETTPGCTGSAYACP